MSRRVGLVARRRRPAASRVFMTTRLLHSGEILRGAFRDPLPAAAVQLKRVNFRKAVRVDLTAVPEGCVPLTPDELAANLLEPGRPLSALSTRASSSTTPDSITDELTCVKSPNFQNGVNNGRASPVKLTTNGNGAEAKNGTTNGNHTPVKPSENGHRIMINLKRATPPPVKVGFDKSEPSAKKAALGTECTTSTAPSSSSTTKPPTSPKKPETPVKEPTNGTPKFPKSLVNGFGPSTPPLTNGRPKSPVKPMSSGPCYSASSTNSPLKTINNEAGPSKPFIGPVLPPHIKLDNNSDENKRMLRKRPAEDEAEYAYGWTKFDSQFTRRLHSCGFLNSRNDCFINSVLQFVMHTPQLLRYILKQRHACNDLAGCMFCSINKIYDNVLKGATKLSCKDIRKIVNDGFPGRWFDSQEDAHEMLTFLLQKLEPPIQSLKNGDRNPVTEIDRIFGGLFKRKVVCNQCNVKSVSNEEFRELNLNLIPQPQGGEKLQDFISTFFKKEHMKGYKCERCKAVDKSYKVYKIFKLPNVLIIQLKRFRPNGSKLQIPIEVPNILDLKTYCVGDEPVTYRLYGYISHYGSTTSSGHYTAHMRGFNGKFYSFDDEQVSFCDINNGPVSHPYVLFYYNDQNSTVALPNRNGLMQRFSGGIPHKKIILNHQFKSPQPNIIT